jgi:hypothetical protein
MTFDHVEFERLRIKTEAQAVRKETTWRLIEDGADGGAWRSIALRVIWSVATELDDRPWLHVSVSRPDRLPSYLDMKQVHAVFIGDRFAYSVWAPPDEHVSIHDNCLHLWCPLEGERPLPDFTRGMGTI